MVASADRDGAGGVEGQMEELKNCTLQNKTISGAQTVRRGAVGGQRLHTYTRSFKHHLISPKS